MGLFNRSKKEEKVTQPTVGTISDNKKSIKDVAKSIVTKKSDSNVADEKKTTASATDKAVKKPKTSATDNTAAKQLATEILLQPIVTEKASISGAYYFKVKTTTNRNEVKKAFVALYGKTPRKVNMMNMGGKKVRFGKMTGKRNDWKKAIVYLNKGESVDVFSE